MQVINFQLNRVFRLSIKHALVSEILAPSEIKIMAKRVDNVSHLLLSRQSKYYKCICVNVYLLASNDSSFQNNSRYNMFLLFCGRHLHFPPKDMTLPSLCQNFKNWSEAFSRSNQNEKPLEKESKTLVLLITVFYRVYGNGQKKNARSFLKRKEPKDK